MDSGCFSISLTSLSSFPLRFGVKQFYKQGCPPFLPPLPVGIYRRIVCQACCLSLCVTLFLTTWLSLSWPPCVCGGVCVTAGLSFGLRILSFTIWNC